MSSDEHQKHLNEIIKTFRKASPQVCLSLF